MKNLKFAKILCSGLVVSGLLLLGGCSSQNVKPENVPGGSGQLDGGAGSSSGGAGQGSNGNASNLGGAGGQYSPEDLKNPNSPLSKRVIYFELDSYRVSAEFLPVLEAHASLLASYPSMNVRLEGHADERGSREYNVALSEQRGKAVKDILMRGNAPVGQMEVVAYGEEMPIAKGHNETSWRVNRRVELKYAGE